MPNIFSTHLKFIINHDIKIMHNSIEEEKRHQKHVASDIKKSFIETFKLLIRFLLIKKCLFSGGFNN